MSPTTYSRRGFLLAGTAAGLSLPLAYGQPEAAADADATSAKEVTTANFFPGFSTETVETNGTTIHVLRKGTGRPLLLPHG